MEVVFERANILIYDKMVSGIKEFLPTLEKAAPAMRLLVRD